MSQQEYDYRMQEKLEMQTRLIERQADTIKFLELQLKDAMFALQDLKFQLGERYDSLHKQTS